MPDDLLRVSDLKIQFEMALGTVRAVDGIDMRVGKNEAVGLVGESGCGKSVTALSMLGLVPQPGKIKEGKIVFRGRNLLDFSDDEMTEIRGKEISMVFQDPVPYLNPVMRVGDQISETIVRHQGISKSQAKEKTIEILEKVYIPSASDMAKYYPHQLSGGMCQRVMIAMALSSNPSLLIADEPTTALDVTVQSQILELIKELKSKLGISLLLITHDLGIMADICDRVYVMYAGKVVEESDIFQMFKNPRHPYSRGLLDSALSIDEFKEDLVGILGTVPDPFSLPLGCKFHPRCKHAMERCRRDDPSMKTVCIGTSVACWLYN